MALPAEAGSFTGYNLISHTERSQAPFTVLPLRETSPTRLKPSVLWRDFYGPELVGRDLKTSSGEMGRALWAFTSSGVMGLALDLASWAT